MEQLTRAFSTITVKGIDEEQRIITGIASTPTPDRVLDSVLPMGVTFKNPLPLLWQHDSLQPVGTANFDPPTPAGITFTARIAKIIEPGALKDRCDEAFQSVRARLVTAVSIGFRVLDNAVEPIKGGGLRYLSVEVMELSLVTIPAQPDAKILTVRDASAAATANRPRQVMHVQTLAELDAEFAVSKTMTTGIYAAKRAAILSPNARDKEALEASESAGKDEKFVTFGNLKKNLMVLARVTIKTIFSPLSARISAVAESVTTLSREVAPIGERLKTIESDLATAQVRIGALSMMAGNKGQAQNPPEIEALTRQLEKAVEINASLERRLSRHSEHLNGLESRLKIVEHK